MIAWEYKTGRLAPAGFVCLWKDQVTFVSSAWVRQVTRMVERRRPPHPQLRHMHRQN
jgi:hypothetical protein